MTTSLCFRHLNSHYLASKTKWLLFRDLIYMLLFLSYVPCHIRKTLSTSHAGPLNRKVPVGLSCNVLVAPSTALFSRRPFFGKDDMNRETGNSNHTVKAFPLNYLVMASFYRHRVYLWTLLKALYLAAVFQRVSPQWIRLPQCLVFLSVSRSSAAADIKRQGVS